MCAPPAPFKGLLKHFCRKYSGSDRRGAGNGGKRMDLGTVKADGCGRRASVGPEGGRRGAGERVHGGGQRFCAALASGVKQCSQHLSQ